MKQLIFIILCIYLVFIDVKATGDPNIDAGGGGTGSGTNQNKWSIGDDGVRVTVIKESTKSPVTTPLDFTNTSPANDIYHFGKASKIHYSNNKGLSLQPGVIYKNVKPTNSIPPIVTSDGRNNIAEIKDYFCAKTNIEFIAQKTGFNYDTLINGEYVILLEPLVYITYSGIKYCMTATEAALYDQIVSGDMKRKLGFVTHQNLPLSMFLERPDLGYQAWKGASSGLRANSDIISQLGIGTVRFTEGPCCDHPPDCECIIDEHKPFDCRCKIEHPDEECSVDDPRCDCKPIQTPDGGGGGQVTAPDYIYRTNTEVITSIKVYNDGDGDISPDNPATVTFNIGGKNYTKGGVIIPPHESTLVWVKWKTPSSPQKMTIDVSVESGSIRKAQIVADIVELEEITPPDPKPTDTKPNLGWHPKSVPSERDKSSLNWIEWTAEWIPDLQWVEDMQWDGYGCDSDCAEDCAGGHGEWIDNGKWVDKGKWEYTSNNYSAHISVKLTVKPDSLIETVKQRFGTPEIKSGYGVNVELVTGVGSNADSTDITPLQWAVAVFPEFDYKTYNRILEPTVSGFDTNFQLYNNKYSFKNARVQYTPIWFPDDDKYEPQVVVFDAWCPKGQLYMYKSDYVWIKGDVYDDWNIAPVNPAGRPIE